MGKSNVVLIGMPGCGKSTIAKYLSNELNINYIDLDKYIQGKTNKTIEELFKIGEDYFRDVEANICKDVSELSDLIISTGGGVVKRKVNIDNLRKNGTIIFIDRPLDNILGDVNTTTRPLLKDGKDRLVNLYNERYDLYKKYCDIHIINNNTLDGVINVIIKALKEYSKYES